MNAPRRYSPRLQEISLQVSSIEPQYFIWNVPRSSILAGLIVFKGVYRPGSAGKNDALFIRWRIDEFCEYSPAGRISGLIVDLRELDYQWGDDLSIYPTRLIGPAGALRIVVNPERRAAFEGILGGQNLRLDLEEACAEVVDVLRGPRKGE